MRNIDEEYYAEALKANYDKKVEEKVPAVINKPVNVPVNPNLI
jgi:hypothetical protein